MVKTKKKPLEVYERKIPNDDLEIVSNLFLSHKGVWIFSNEKISIITSSKIFPDGFSRVDEDVKDGESKEVLRKFSVIKFPFFESFEFSIAQVIKTLLKETKTEKIVFVSIKVNLLFGLYKQKQSFQEIASAAILHDITVVSQ